MEDSPTADDYELPGKPDSLWLATTPGTEYPTLAAGLMVDVAIVGGGIVGATAASLLKEAGLTVAVIESRRVVTGVTGYTTAKITSQHGLIYHRLTERFGADAAAVYAQANQAGLEKIAELVETKSIACDFFRAPAYTFTETEAESGCDRN
ncbi:MAG: FAD-binding oxidoreductase [Actinomycetota bacterium]|nr:FAD-binding oxidoreductase [Actinomycetota bacterium]